MSSTSSTAFVPSLEKPRVWTVEALDSVAVQKVAPMGDPIEITVRGYELSIRKSEAEMVEVN